jgi:hypothetical protein
LGKRYATANEAAFVREIARRAGGRPLSTFKELRDWTVL